MIKGTLRFLWETAEIVVIALLIVVPIRYFIFQPFFVRGQSMEPGFHDGDYLIIDELTYRLRLPQRGEVIVFKYPQNPSQRYIKRIIGLPGEVVEIRDGGVFIMSEQKEMALEENDYLLNIEYTPGQTRLVLGQDEYFVLGDNRVASSDSRKWGAVPENYIIGRVLLRAWPPDALAYIEAPSY